MRYQKHLHIRIIGRPCTGKKGGTLYIESVYAANISIKIVGDENTITAIIHCGNRFLSYMEALKGV